MKLVRLAVATAALLGMTAAAHAEAPPEAPVAELSRRTATVEESIQSAAESGTISEQQASSLRRSNRMADLEFRVRAMRGGSTAAALASEASIRSVEDGLEAYTKARAVEDTLR